MDIRLVEALELHKKWLKGKPEGQRFCYDNYKDIKVTDEFVGADLRSADFSGASLVGVSFNKADLSDALFLCANLIQASFMKAKLTETNFEAANLFRAFFFDANLSQVNFRETNLASSSFNWTKLSCADFFNANLKNSNFNCATIFSCNFQDANLHNVYFGNADLKDLIFYGSNLTGAKWVAENFDTMKFDHRTIGLAPVCPEKGEYIGYKSCSKKIVELRIPADALRSSGTTRKCRASKAEVISITELDGRSSDVDFVVSDYDENFIYKVGETVEVEDFDTNRWDECTTGIHHFMSRSEAIDYYYYFFP